LPITFHPRAGLILQCDFSNGFKEPEMIKKRPVIVLTPPMKGRNDLTTVVCLSSVEPSNIMPYHYLLPKASMPMTGHFQKGETWVKGDMIYSVGHHRLEAIRTGKDYDGKRQYFNRVLGRDQMAEIYKCVLHGLNLGHLELHI